MDCDITVAELQAMLEDYAPDTRVRFAHQPSYPMQVRIGHEMAYRSSRDSETKIVYLLDGGQPYDAPYAPSDIFQMTEEPMCSRCGLNDCAQGEEWCAACLEQES